MMAEYIFEQKNNHSVIPESQRLIRYPGASSININNHQAHQPRQFFIINRAPVFFPWIPNQVGNDRGGEEQE